MDLLKKFKIEKLKKVDWKLFFIILGLFLIISTIAGVDISFLFVFSTWSILMFYSLTDLKNRLLLAAFLSSFFVFLLGGHLVYEYLGMGLSYYFGYEYYLHSNITMGLSLIFLFIGVKVVEQISIYLKANKSEQIADLNIKEEGHKRELLRFIAKILYIATYIFYLYVVLDKVIFVLNNSYYSYYVDYQRNIPFIINAIAAMTPYFYYLFLASLPSKKETMPLIILQLAYALVTLFTGRRIDFIIIILFTIIYFIFRHYYDKGKEEWIKKQHVIAAMIAIPVFLVILFLYNYLRHGIPVSEFSIKEILFGFFQQQGFSSSVIRLGLFHQDALDDNTLYSLFGLVKFVRTNTLIGLFFDFHYDFSYIGNSVDFALNGNSLSHTLSYLALGDRYLAGSGVGSAYIAELYHDFGYLGIAIGNAIYGGIIATISALWMRAKKYSVWITAICFSLVESFLKVPRWNFDIVFTDFLRLGMWSAFLGIFICYIILKNEKVEKYMKYKGLGRLIYGNQEKH